MSESTAAALALRAKLIRNFNTATGERFERPPLYDSVFAGLTGGTGAKKLGCAIDVVAPGKQTCPYHLHHAQEEMFIVLEGVGTLRVAGELIAIGPGDVITIPAGPEYPHHILNTSSAPLKYLSISTQETPEICEYPDSGKMSASVKTADGTTVVRNRAAANLDYWDGEP